MHLCPDELAVLTTVGNHLGAILCWCRHLWAKVVHGE